MFEYMTVRELYELSMGYEELEKDALEYIEIQGWVRTNRNNGSIGFIELNDGTYFKSAQLVYSKEDKEFETYCKYSTGTALTVMGKLVLTPMGKQPFEIQVREIALEGACSEDYPLQKKRHSFEYLREIAHLRPRANTFNAVFRVRSALTMAIHEFFQTQGFVHVNVPSIKHQLEKDDSFVNVIYDEENKCCLSKSGQLNLEAYALAFRDVYSFNTCFDSIDNVSENVQVEAEIAFADLEDSMLLADDLIKFCINYVLENCAEEIEFFDKMIEIGLKDRLNNVLNNEFKKVSYNEALSWLDMAAKEGNFEDKDIYWGMKFAQEHVDYLCSVLEENAFLTDSPKDTKDFTCKVNEDGKTVASYELIANKGFNMLAGAQREENYNCLEKRIKDCNIEIEKLNWYLDLRKFGGCNHSGFKLDFDKLVMYVTGVNDLREVIPFVVSHRNLKF